MDIIFRAVEPQDAELFYEVENDSSAWADSDTFAPYSRHLLRQYAENYKADILADCQLRLVAAGKASQSPIGIIDFYEISFMHSRAFIGIYILPHYRRQGLGTQVIEMGVEYARRRLNLRILAARILDSNPASLHLFKKCGFKTAGVFPDWQIVDGKPCAMTVVTRIL